MLTLDKNVIEEAIVRHLKKSGGYMTINHLSHVTGSAPQEVEQFVISHPEKIRKSQIETDDGQPLFTLNTPLSGVADAWTAFRHANAKKY